MLIHRLSAHIFKNFNLRSRKCVLHKCDNPARYNPHHLYIGTRVDNNLDYRNKKLFADGRTNGACRLTAFDVLEIKKMLRVGGRVKTIAQKYDVAPSTVQNIKDGYHWGWLNDNRVKSLKVEVK